MSPAFSIALLLLSTTVVKTVEDWTEEEEDFPSQLKGETADHHAEEILQAEDLCSSCKSLVSQVKKKMDDNTSKDKVAKLMDNVCSQEKNEQVKEVCKKITGKIKDKLSETIANKADPESACKKVKLCQKKPPHTL
ncbi:antimicrobial peptide NK-lysin-like [Morone saxatilis]|uniref:antimicrobial peptide NK-lysin-like n=1 Tax=Morone saxatilis TaxID=34816 RepID=UPI0015E243AA|nr:antimicrobial peptide NK-lysin-like [Morone saxatilis]